MLLKFSFYLFMISLSFVMPTTLLADSKTIKVSCSDYPPFIMNPKYNNGLEGINIEILRRIYKDYGYELKISWMTFPRAVKDTETGHYDFICGVTKSHTKKLILSPISIGKARVAILSSKRSDFVYNGIDSLRDRNIGRIAGLNHTSSSPEYESLIRNHNPKKIFINTGEKAIERMFKMLEIKRVDAFAVSYELALFLLGKVALEKRFKVLDFHRIPLEGYVGFSPKSKRAGELKELYESGMKKYYNGQFWQKVYRKYSTK